nr:MAG TPA: hypothetical protein [Caudoviricetes sp.]
MKDGICRLLFCEERISHSLELIHTYTPPFCLTIPNHCSICIDAGKHSSNFKRIKSFNSRLSAAAKACNLALKLAVTRNAIISVLSSRFCSVFAIFFSCCFCLRCYTFH